MARGIREYDNEKTLNGTTVSKSENKDTLDYELFWKYGIELLAMGISAYEIQNTYVSQRSNKKEGTIQDEDVNLHPSYRD